MFDKNFFKFFTGFVLIIAASFVVLYVASSYTMGGQGAAVEISTE